MNPMVGLEMFELLMLAGVLFNAAHTVHKVRRRREESK